MWKQKPKVMISSGSFLKMRANVSLAKDSKRSCKRYHHPSSIGPKYTHWPQLSTLHEEDPALRSGLGGLYQFGHQTYHNTHNHVVDAMGSSTANGTTQWKHYHGRILYWNRKKTMANILPIRQNWMQNRFVELFSYSFWAKVEKVTSGHDFSDLDTCFKTI